MADRKMIASLVRSAAAAQNDAAIQVHNHFHNRILHNGSSRLAALLQLQCGITTTPYSTTSAKTSNVSPHLHPSMASTQSWSDEWKSKGLGARLPKPGSIMTNLLFVQMGFGVDQHGNDDANRSGSGQGATKAALRAVRNAIEFNSIPGIIEAVPGGREEMLISVKLGVPMQRGSTDPMEVNLNEVAKVFPYGRLLPFEIVVGGLSFHTGRIVRELGDNDDLAVCVAASVSIGYDSGRRGDGETETIHKQYDTNDGV